MSLNSLRSPPRAGRPRQALCLLIVLLPFAAVLCAEPGPGDWYREYTWRLPGGDESEAFLRVGGRFDYREQRPPLPSGSEGGDIRFPFRLALEGARRAEVSVEKTLCHDHTTGLAIAFNRHPPRRFPEPVGIPTPAAAYMYHFHPTLEVPLEELRPDDDNRFSLSVAPEQPWGWPQNLIYAVTVRIYYDPPTGPAVATMVPLEGEIIGLHQPVAVRLHPPEDVDRVDFVAHYAGPDLGGDGRYEKWHHYSHRGELRGHLGSAFAAPFTAVWETEWVPDQEEPVQLGAIVSFRDGLRHFVPPVKGRLVREHSVELCRPYGQPEVWVTRNGRHSCFFNVEGNLNQAEAFQIVWRTWSPGYLNGLYLNDFVLLTREGDHYAYDEHHFTSQDIRLLRPGENWITTGKTPRYQGEMVHGAEILWPGPMVLVKYDSKEAPPRWHAFAEPPTEADASAAFRGAWTEAGLLVMVEVTDPEPAPEDAVNLLLRADPMQLRTRQPSDDHDYLLRLKRGADAAAVFRQQVDRPPLQESGVETIQRATGKGWEACFFVPWDLLGLPARPAHDRALQLGFELVVADQDAEAPPDYLIWANRRQVPSLWIEHNHWGVAELSASDPGSNRGPRPDWTRLPGDEPVPAVIFPAWPDPPPFRWEPLRARFAAEPTNTLDHWLPGH